MNQLTLNEAQRKICNQSFTYTFAFTRNLSRSPSGVASHKFKSAYFCRQNPWIGTNICSFSIILSLSRQVLFSETNIHTRSSSFWYSSSSSHSTKSTNEYLCFATDNNDFHISSNKFRMGKKKGTWISLVVCWKGNQINWQNLRTNGEKMATLVGQVTAISCHFAATKQVHLVVVLWLLCDAKWCDLKWFDPIRSEAMWWEKKKEEANVSSF